MRKGVDRTDVVVIGGGIMGASTALWLAERGLAVTLCEKGEIGREQSGRNWGWCRTFGRDIRELELSLLSLRLWRGLNEMIGRETGFRQSGILSLAEDDDHLDTLRTMHQQLAGSEVAAELIDGNAAARLTTGAVRQWLGGLHAPGDGRAEPLLAAPAIAEGARDKGAVLHTGSVVQGIDMSGGRVSAVETSRGRIDCDAVVIAAGAWSTKLCRQLGFRVPQWIVTETVCRTAPVSGGPDVSLRTKAYSLRRRLDGGYTVGGGGKIRAELTPDSFRFFRDFIPILRAYGSMIQLRPTDHAWSDWKTLLGAEPSSHMLDPPPDEVLSRRVCGALARDFPAFAGIDIVERWAGGIDVTPDALPVISPLPVSGAFLLTGFSGHGFGMGPGAGALMAALVAGDTPPIDPRPFDVSRLTSGEKIVLGPL